MTNCWLCSNPLTTPIREEDYGNILNYHCNQCGMYSVLKSITETTTITAIEKQKIAGWLYEYGDIIEITLIDKPFIEKIKRFSLPNLNERANRLLNHITKFAHELGQKFDANDNKLIPVTYSKSPKELNVIFTLLQDKGFINRAPGSATYRITPEGYVYLENMQNNNTNSTQAFVAMWFNPVLQEIFDDGFDVGIKNAGYNAFRVDMREHVGKVDDEIISQIRQSKFIVADFTGHRGGVYFEAGFAMGLGLPVFWTCRKDGLADLHFDIRQYNCIVWETKEELAIKLQLRIEAVIGKGPIV